MPAMHPEVPAPSMPSPADAAGDSFTFDLPDGWADAGATGMRVVNLTLPEGGECYVTVLSSGGGGVGANVNRWRKQFSLEDLSDADIAALPTIPMLGGEAKRVRATGTYMGMRGEANEANYGLIGALLATPEDSIFVKLLGPEAMVQGQENTFDAFCASLARAEAPAPTTAAMPAGHPPVTGQAGEMPSGHPPVAGHDLVGGVTPESIGPGQLTYAVPATWGIGEERPIRYATYTTPDGQAECYITIMSGNAGGTEANINMWRSQLGQEDMNPIEMAALPKLNVLGSESPFVEIEGSYQSMQGEEIKEAKMFGTICSQEGNTIFVKMVGPKSSVEPEREAFRAFCESFKLGE